MLLILAGVGISALSGDNGILTQASKAKEATERADESEQVQLAVQIALMDQIEGINARKLEKELGLAENSLADSGPWRYQGKHNIYIIETNGKITSYKELNYIESTGTQWINTNYIPTKYTEINIDMQFLENENTHTNNTPSLIFGVSHDDPYRFNANFGEAAGQEREIYYWVDKRPQDGAKIKNNTYPLNVLTNRFLLKVKSKLAILDGIETALDEKTNDSTTTLKLLAFDSNYVFKKYNARIYTCKIWDGETLVRDFCPALDNMNRACLYDKIENKFYYNNGSGEFLYK